MVQQHVTASIDELSDFQGGGSPMPTRKIVFPSIMLFLVIVLATFLAACGGDEATPTPT